MKTLQAVRTDEPITIDGRLDEAAWADAAAVEDFHQISPLEYVEPSQHSIFYVLYDNEALYVAARMYDEPGGVTANVMRQGGDSWSDDQFYIVLDPFNDKRSGYKFQINPHARAMRGCSRAPESR